MNEKGNLSINSENIMPIIKKWLYSDSDIFLRELVSNACDAITKLQKLISLGEAEAADEKYRVDVRLDKAAGTITVSDNGVGMTADEVKKYINQIAFSGASDFVERYKLNENSGAAANDIIGHFGLGFYSAFMVADKVAINTLSWQAGAEAVNWVSDGSTEYEISAGEKAGRGTDITLYVGEHAKEFLDAYKLKSTLKKYCGYLPIEIYFSEEIEKAKAKVVDEEGETVLDGEEPEEEKPVNDTNPLWTRPPAECTDEQYKEFYREAFFDFNEPLFWIHLNMDYPFRLKGILYFPKLKHELESIEGQVKLFNNQVFVAENIKEVIPEFLLLLKGAIDCPDLPLNVSRSFLQNDGYVTKMSAYITKKVADKLNSVFTGERENYNKFWDDINQFIKYGCIREKDFYDKVKESVVYKTVAGEYLTSAEYLERNREKAGDRIFYVTDEQRQAQYVRMFKAEGLDAVLMTTRLDAPFMSYVEGYERGFKFARIDADISDALKGESPADSAESEALCELFKTVLDKKDLTVKAENLKNGAVSAVMLLSEESRRMKDMSAMFGGMNFGAMKDEETLVLNLGSPLIRLISESAGDEAKKDAAALACRHVYDLAALSHKPLSSDDMAAFIERSNEILERLL